MQQVILFKKDLRNMLILIYIYFIYIKFVNQIYV